MKVEAYTRSGADARFATRAEVEAVRPGVVVFDTIEGLLTHPDPAGLPRTVVTAGHSTASDGAGLVLTNETWTPQSDHVYGRVGIPLRGRWFIPRNLSTAPRTSPVKDAVDAVVARARTYVDAGTEIEWNADVLTPLQQGGPQRTPAGKWGLTCSSFAGMVLSGLAYRDTTYVAGSNTRRDPQVRFGRLTTQDPWQAHRMARWAFVNGDTWVPVAGDWQPGDVLFWGKQEPEGPGTTGTYFLNIYHVGLYVGGGMLIQSKSASDPQGVMHEPLSGMPDEVVLAWRPQYGTPVGTGSGGGGSVDLSAYLRTADAQGMFADKVATSTALNNRYPKVDSDARYALKGDLDTLARTSALEAEQAARAQADTRIEGLVTAESSTREEAVSAVSGRVQALEANVTLVPARNRIEVGRTELTGSPVQVANSQSGFDVVFAKPFDTVPRVVVSVGKVGDPSGTLRASTGVVTRTGFRLWVAGSVSTGWVDWFATDGAHLPAGQPQAGGGLVLAEGAPVPEGTPSGTLIIRTKP